MIRVDLSRDPERWWPVTFLDEEGEPEEIRIRYALLDLATVAQYRREQMALALSGVGSNADDAVPSARQAFLQALIDRLDPAELDARRAVLEDRLRGWEFVGADNQTLAFDARSVGAVVRRPGFFAPLWDGLLEASEGSAKKSAKSGSTGGRTTNSHG